VEDVPTGRDTAWVYSLTRGPSGYGQRVVAAGRYCRLAVRSGESDKGVAACVAGRRVVGDGVCMVSASPGLRSRFRLSVGFRRKHSTPKSRAWGCQLCRRATHGHLFTKAAMRRLMKGATAVTRACFTARTTITRDPMVPRQVHRLLTNTPGMKTVRAATSGQGGTFNAQRTAID